MGIQGLLPLLKSIMVPIHIKDLEGCSVAVDTYSWLHKGALSCSKELCKGLPTSRHIDYCMHRVNLLRHNGVKPVLVFDGGLLPMKGEQENKRARSRKENLARAIEHESNGNMAAAYECYQKAVDITPLIAHELIQVLKKENVSYVVAPYEADAQMTFLAVSKQVDAVITEDSDLIPFGCPRIIFKMDKFGQAVQFQYSILQQNKELNFSGFTKQMLLEMCIFSGCDYLQSLPGMGLKRAHALVKRFTTYEKVIKHLRYSISSVPPQYEESFKKAILTFQHQRVYDPVTEEVVHMSDIPSDALENFDFLGPDIPRDIAKGIAEGDRDPFTGLPFEVENTSVGDAFKLKNVNHGTVKKKLDLPVQKNLLTKYFCFASIEAKRNFRAPRSSPKQQSQSGDSSLAPAENVKCVTLKTSFTENFEDDKDTEDHARRTEHIFLQQLKHPIHRPCLMQRKDHKLDSDPDQLDDEVRLEENKVVSSSHFQQKKANKSDHENASEDSGPENIPDSFEGKIRKETRKVVVRSSYFQHKPVNESDRENSLNVPPKENLYTGTYEKSVNDDFRVLKRRKTTPESDNVQVEHVTSKQICTEIDEEKFGAKISHLAQYSDIAEKSMEKFVSVISSFKFSSSGSRASGLRAPFKDIRNTATNRSTAHADFNRFAFAAPKKS